MKSLFYCKERDYFIYFSGYSRRNQLVSLGINSLPSGLRTLDSVSPLMNTALHSKYAMLRKTILFDYILH